MNKSDLGLQLWLVTAASLIGSMPNGAELKEVFDLAYADARTKYFVDKYPVGLDIEAATVERLKQTEAKLNEAIK